MKTSNKIAYLVTTILLVGCADMFDYSTYVVDFEGENKAVTQTNIEKLTQKDNNDTIRIAFTGDSHRFYDELEDFVEGVNKVNKNNPIDFVIHVGDIADFGLPQQYLWGNSFLLNLDCPYFVTIGNHDLVGNGSLAYSEMFGDFNFSFIYGEIKFIFINTNSREFNYNGNVPDINWLELQLQPSDEYIYAVVIFHVPPSDSDFDASLESAFHTTIARYENVLFTIHGHTHHHEEYKPYPDSVSYINIYGAQHKKFNVIKIKDENFDIETYKF